MSDLPAPITKHSLSAPPRSRRSIRYSATAQGRGASFKVRAPTGSSSFENASGWMREPRPAAGMMPHISCHQGLRTTRALEQRDQFVRAMLRGVFGQRAFARGFADAFQFGIGKIQRLERIARVARQQDFLVWSVERRQSRPVVAQD